MKITLKAARVNVGLTQVEAASLLGVSKISLGRWERGDGMPRKHNFEAACRLYGVCPEDIEISPYVLMREV